MTGTASPADRSGQDDNTNTDALAGADNGGAVDTTAVSGDANLSTDAPSASGEPGAKKDATEPTLKDVLKDAASLGEDGKPVASPAAAKDGAEKVVEGEKPADKTAEQLAEEDKALPFHNHPRWKQVIEQNRTMASEVATLKPAAEQFEKIDGFMREHQLTHDEVGEGFVIMAMMKAGDPRVLQKLDETRDKVALAIGAKIPDDIQAKIDAGEISEEAGKTMSLDRAKLKMSESATARRAEADATDKTEREATELRQTCQAATDAWVKEAAKTDPDFAKKESAIARYSRALILEHGAPRNREEAVNLVKAAYAAVNNDLKGIVPAKAPVKHLQSAPSSHGANTQPKTLAEAVSKAAAM